MPSLLKCEGCGCLLAEWPELPPHFYSQKRVCHHRNSAGTFWYVTIYEWLHGKCPNCHRQLLSPRQFQEKATIEISQNNK